MPTDSVLVANTMMLKHNHANSNVSKLEDSSLSLLFSSLKAILSDKNINDIVSLLEKTHDFIISLPDEMLSPQKESIDKKFASIKSSSFGIIRFRATQENARKFSLPLFIFDLLPFNYCDTLFICLFISLFVG